PPPPLKPPLSLELLPLLQPPPLLPLDQPPLLLPPPVGMKSTTKATMDANTPIPSAAATPPNRNQTRSATAPPVAIEPISRPSALRKTPLMINAKNSQNGLNTSKLKPSPSQCVGSGSGSFSPLIRPIILSIPAEMPPAKSPLLNFGVIISSMMRLEV